MQTIFWHVCSNIAIKFAHTYRNQRKLMFNKYLDAYCKDTCACGKTLSPASHNVGIHLNQYVALQLKASTNTDHTTIQNVKNHLITSETHQSTFFEQFCLFAETIHFNNWMNVSRNHAKHKICCHNVSGKNAHLFIKNSKILRLFDRND